MVKTSSLQPKLIFIPGAALMATIGGSELPQSRFSATLESALAGSESKLNSLPEEYRHVVELRTWRKQSFEEIGRQLDRSPEVARKLWSRAIRQLGKLLAESE